MRRAGRRGRVTLSFCTLHVHVPVPPARPPPRTYALVRVLVLGFGLETRRHASDGPRLPDSGPTHSQFTREGCQGAHSRAHSPAVRARVTRRRQRKGMSHLRRDGERQRARDPSCCERPSSIINQSVCVPPPPVVHRRPDGGPSRGHDRHDRGSRSARRPQR